MFTKNGMVGGVVAWAVLMNARYAECVPDDECFSSGSVAGAVIGTLIVTLALLCACYFVWKHYWKSRKGKHLVLETDPEMVADQFAFDNPCFKDAGVSPFDKHDSKVDLGKTKWTHWSPLGALSSYKNEKRRTIDDSLVEAKHINLVSLRSHDFTGLGFNVQGNMRDGIFVKDVLHRGPASESGKVTSGDRIVSVRISFSHMVYEDALTILSYASPYEVQLELETSTRNINKAPTLGGGGVAHPIYRSGSSGDLNKIGKSVRQRLFQPHNSPEDGENTTQKPASQPASLERPMTQPTGDVNTLTKPERTKKAKAHSPTQLKAQLEQDLLKNNMKLTESFQNSHNDPIVSHPEPKTIVTVESETNKPDTNKKFQKIGIRVLPLAEGDSPKIVERSQNENNINLERHTDMRHLETSRSPDEVDNPDAVSKVIIESPSTEVEIKPDIREGPEFARRNSINSSGIKRDQAGIPQEIPDHMLNAANVARKNRKSGENIEVAVHETEIQDGQKSASASAKKSKGKAPAPPPTREASEPQMNTTLEGDTNPLNFTDNFLSTSDSDVTSHEIPSKDADVEKEPEVEPPDHINNNSLLVVKPTVAIPYEEPEVMIQAAINSTVTEDLTNSDQIVSGSNTFDYSSDSDADTDQNSVINNTIELNASDITIHHSSGNSESESTDVGNDSRKAASLGDLSKYDQGMRSNTATLERAQSLDITDAGIPAISKKRKAPTRPEDEMDVDNFNSDEVLYSNSHLKNKEPRLSLVLDNLSTFQRNRLKKSSQWGNLEDAISDMSTNVEDMNGGYAASEEILPKIQKRESNESIQLKSDRPHEINVNGNNYPIIFSALKPNVKKSETDEKETASPNSYDYNGVTPNSIPTIESELLTSHVVNQLDDTKDKLEFCLKNTSESLLSNEKYNAENPVLGEKLSLHFSSKLYDTNVSDDIKVSRHSLGSLERPKSDVLKNVNKLKQLQSMIQSDLGGVSNVTVTTDEGKSEMMLPMQQRSFEIAPVTIRTTEFLPEPEINDNATSMNGTNISLEGGSQTDLKNITQFEITNAADESEHGGELYTTAIDTSLDPNINSNIVSGIAETEDSKLNVTLKATTQDPAVINLNVLENLPELPKTTPPKSQEMFFDGNISPLTIQSNSFVTEIEVSPISEKNVSEIVVNNGVTDSTKYIEKPPKKLPEMKFSTSSYEISPSPEKRMSQIEVLRSNFENKNSFTALKSPTSPTKSKIPVATVKTSPERPFNSKLTTSDQESGDEKEIIDIMAKSIVHSTPLSSQKHHNIKNPVVKSLNNKNVTVTSIRTSSKIPSGHFGAGNYPSRPPIPPRRNESTELSPNHTESTFQQWVFTPTDPKGSIGIERKQE